MVYDVFRILRIALSHNSSVILIEDLLFWCIAAVATFGFFLVNDDGRIHIFLLAGETIGFILYYFTLGMLVLGAAKRIIAAIRWVFRLVDRALLRPILLVVKKITGIFVKIENILAFYLKKHAKNSNMHLKKYRELLYNHKRRFPRIRRKGRVTDESCTSEKT